jgi:Ala-tRNA(Pro) deacylase
VPQQDSRRPRAGTFRCVDASAAQVPSSNAAAERARDDQPALPDRHGIEYLRADHPAVYTCEEARKETRGLPGAETKSLFVRDGKGRRHFLVNVRPETRVDLKTLGEVLGAASLRFASAARLERHLGPTAGSVTLLGVVNDRDGAVEVVVVEDLWREPSLQCHPLVNTSTLVVSREGLERLFAVTGHTPRVVAVPSRAD